MDIIRLKYFIAAAERLNFTIAAKERYITQTAMSLHIKKMEDELGFKLFLRDKRSIKLTEAGSEFYKRAVQLVAQYEMAIRSVKNIASGARGNIGVMVPGYSEGFILIDKLRAFCIEYPDVNLTMLVEQPRRHIAELKSGTADITIGFMHDTERDPEIITKNLREDPIYVVCNVNHPFAKMEKVSVDLIKEERTIILDPEELPSVFREMLSDSEHTDIGSDTVLPVKNFGEMLLNVALERGIGFLPAFAVARLIANQYEIVRVPIEQNGVTPTVASILCYLKRSTNPVLKILVDFMLEK